MIDVRAAGPDDAPELVRLREIMLADILGAGPASNSWQKMAETSLRQRLAWPGGVLAAFVVDQEDRAGLAACAIGVVEQRLGSPANPSGEIGCVFNVATDP